MSVGGLFHLEGSVAAVIGGTGTLGGAIAAALAKHGAAVAVLGRNAERGEAVSAEIRADGGRSQFLAADASDPDSVRAAAEDLKASFGACSILVNCAGGNTQDATIDPGRSFEDISVDAWRAAFVSNVEAGVLIPSQVFAPMMADRGGGGIINIASVSAHIPLSRVPAYSAAKASVVSLTKFLAREWAEQGIRVNSITPGFFLADQNRHILIDQHGNPTERAQQILNHTPMGRLGDPSDLAGAAVFLASDRASGFVTGTDIRVDGGFLAQTI